MSPAFLCLFALGRAKRDAATVAMAFDIAVIWTFWGLAA